MATQTTEPSERDDTERSSTPAAAAEESTGRALPATAVEQVKNGRLPMLVGGVMAVRGVRDLLSERGGGLAGTAAGLVLLGVGLRQRSKAGAGDSEAMQETEDSLPGSETVSRRSEANVPGHNPRDVDDEPDVATAEAQEEGAVQFETEREDVDVERKPHLEETDPKDPRYPDEGDPETEDDHVDVDVSEPSLADEPNEAVGPDEEQAYPASEGTDPEPSAPKSPERSGEDEAPDTDGEDEAADTDVEDADEASEAKEASAGDDATDDEDADADVDESI